VQSLPLLPVLRERFPEAHISWVINRELAGLLEDHPQLDEIIPFDRRGNWRSSVRLLKRLRRSQFDLVFDLQGLLRTGVMTLATRAAVRVGLESAREGAEYSCNYVIPNSGRLVPAHRRYWRVAEELGLGDRTACTTVAVSPEDEQVVTELLAGVSAPLLAVHPGARWETKRWPIENFAVVAGRAMRRFGWSIAIVGSPGEASLAEDLDVMLRRFVPSGQILNLAGRTTLKQLAALLGRADLLLSNDSGPMHLAAGMGTPVVSVFTCTSPLRSGPPGEQHRLVATRLPCGGSYCKLCPHQGPEHMACMDDLTAEQVWQVLCERIERRAALPCSA